MEKVMESAYTVGVRGAQYLWWFVANFFLMFAECTGRMFGTVGMIAMGALIYEGCGEHAGVLCNKPGEVFELSIFGVDIGSDPEMTGWGVFAFIVGAVWLPLGWSGVDVAVLSALGPTLMVWLLPSLQGNCNDFLGAAGPDRWDVSLLGYLHLSRVMGTFVAAVYPGLMILFVRGGIGAWPEDGGRFATMEDATLTKLRGSVVAGGAFFWIWLVVGATLRQRPDWGPPSMTPLQVDAGCFSVFLLFTGAHMWLQHSLEPTRATLGCISVAGLAGGSTLALLAAGGFQGKPFQGVSHATGDSRAGHRFDGVLQMSRPFDERGYCGPGVPCPPSMQDIVAGSANLTDDLWGVLEEGLWPERCSEAIDCSWTGMYSCPGQQAGAAGVAKDDSSDEYYCCCEEEMWRTAASLDRPEPVNISCWGSWDGRLVLPFTEQDPSSLGSEVPSCAGQSWRPIPWGEGGAATPAGGVMAALSNVTAPSAQGPVTADALASFALAGGGANGSNFALLGAKQDEVLGADSAMLWRLQATALSAVFWFPVLHTIATHPDGVWAVFGCQYRSRWWVDAGMWVYGPMASKKEVGIVTVTAETAKTVLRNERGSFRSWFSRLSAVGPTAFLLSQPWQHYVGFAPAPAWMVASLSGYIDSPAATALHGAVFFGSFLNMWSFGNNAMARPEGTWVGPLEKVFTGTFLGYYQWMFLLMCIVNTGWLEIAHQFLGLAFPLAAFFYLVAILWFNCSWIICVETVSTVLFGLGGAYLTLKARTNDDVKLFWPYSFTAYNRFWLGEAVVLIAVAWFTHFQHVQLIRTSEKRLGDSSTARAAPAISSRSARTSARTSAPATRDGWYMLEEGAPRRDRTVVAEYVRLQRERRKEWTRMV
mmetsp:Transcript_26278/g.76711  ORF Transcript_26278/g.76711 Transcript_26278/m.76711 type:complete len:874 (-) Transcript_26278:115-2736(-)